MGDSLTNGDSLHAYKPGSVARCSWGDPHCRGNWPMTLGALMGPRYKVRNFGYIDNYEVTIYSFVVLVSYPIYLVTFIRDYVVIPIIIIKISNSEDFVCRDSMRYFIRWGFIIFKFCYPILP